MAATQRQSTSQLHNLPYLPTSFVGREEELAEITRLLADPGCRLLTLVGPGGIGKTRLAIQAAANWGELEPDGSERRSGHVFFVNLQSVQAADMLVSAIAGAVNFPLSGQGEPATQLLHYLRDQTMLLVLDNFEQLLLPATEDDVGGDEAINLLTGILRLAPAVKLMVTSREVLNLQDEWLYYVPGMPFPEGDNPDDLEDYSSVQLFILRARRVRPDFSLAHERTGLVRICQGVGGIPLAIELAAAWTKTLSCEMIAAEIQRNLNFLATRLRDVPERHRSMQAVFTQSWKYLTAPERSAFMRLSVFRDGFEHEAAEQVAGASLATLSVLVDKSLLRLEPGGRYHIHELLRQYGAEQLVQSPEDVAHAYDAHCTYYADFLYRRLNDPNGGRQLEAVAEIEADLENIRAMWQWAVAGHKVEEINRSSHALSRFYQFRSRYREGADFLAKAALILQHDHQSDEEIRTLAMILVDQGWFCIRLGQLEKAKDVLEQAWALYQGFDITPPPGSATDPLSALGIIASIFGDYAEAAKFGQAALQASEQTNHRGNLPFALYVLARAALAQGDYPTARTYAQRASIAAEEIGNRWFMAYCLNELGNIAGALGDYAEAKQHYQISYRIRKKFGDAEGMAVALTYLGKVALLEEDYVEAKQLYEQSLAIYQKLNDRGGLATALNGLGMAACMVDEYPAARPYFRQAFEIATDIQYVPLILSILIGIGELFIRTGRQTRGLELFSFIHHHPASDHETRARAQRYLDRYYSELAPDVFAVATEAGQSSELYGMIRAIQTELAAPPGQPDRSPAGEQPLSSDLSAKEASPGPADIPEQAWRANIAALVEPLTAREFEVLQLIAEGQTNRQIAAGLIISVGTAKWYTGQIYSKLNVSNRTQAVARARELGLLG